MLFLFAATFFIASLLLDTIEWNFRHGPNSNEQRKKTFIDSVTGKRFQLVPVVVPCPV